MVTFVAVVFGATAAQKQIGIGAALGGPLVLSTIAYATVGVVLIACRMRLPKTAAIRADFKSLSRDQGWFLVIFAAKIALGVVAFAFKPWLGALFLAAYGAYFWKEMRGESDVEEERARAAEADAARRRRRRPGRRSPRRSSRWW